MVVLAWLGLRGLLDSLVTVERLETWDLRDHKEIGVQMEYKVSRETAVTLEILALMDLKDR
jgi:hypothetical protein